MGSEQALAIIDDCRQRLKEIGVTECLVAIYTEEGGAGYVYNGNPKTLAYLANTALLEVLFESVGVRTDTGGNLDGTE